MRSDDTETAKVYNKFICQRVMVEIYKGCKTKALLIKDGAEDEFMSDDTVKLYILREWMPPDKPEDMPDEYSPIICTNPKTTIIEGLGDDKTPAVLELTKYFYTFYPPEYLETDVIRTAVATGTELHVVIDGECVLDTGLQFGK